MLNESNAALRVCNFLCPLPCLSCVVVVCQMVLSFACVDPFDLFDGCFEVSSHGHIRGFKDYADFNQGHPGFLVWTYPDALLPGDVNLHSSQCNTEQFVCVLPGPGVVGRKFPQVRH